MKTKNLIAIAVMQILCSPASVATVGAQAKLHYVEGAAPSISTIEMYIAQEAGFFKDENLEVTVDFAANGSVATQAIVNNQADVGVITMEPLLIGYDKGLRGKFLFKKIPYLSFSVAVAKGSPVQKLSDLVGKKIGVLNMGSSAIYYVNSMARLEGVSIPADAYLPVGAGDAALTALKTNQVQALALTRLHYAALVRAGNEFRYFVHPTVGDIGTTGFFTSDQALKEKRDSITRFLRAVVKSRIFMDESPASAIRIFWKAQPATKPAGPEDAAIKSAMIEFEIAFPKTAQFSLAKVGKFDEEGLERVVQVLVDEKIIPRKRPLSDFIDQGPLEDAIKTIDEAEIRSRARAWK